MAIEQHLSCPVCSSQILFDPYSLITGARFACPTCPDVSIGLEQGSHAVVKSTLDKFEKLKENVGKMKSEHSSLE